MHVHAEHRGAGGPAGWKIDLIHRQRYMVPKNKGDVRMDKQNLGLFSPVCFVRLGQGLVSPIQDV